MSSHAGNIAVAGATYRIGRNRCGELGNVAGERADIQARASHREGVIDLAGMDDADKRLAHYHQVHVGGIGAMPRRKGLWRPYPVEYKRSRDKHGSSAYQIQLCAQALCLEEMLRTPVDCGALFDGQTRRRVEVTFGSALRGQVEQLAARMHAMYQSRGTPAAVYEKKSEGCSLKPVCLPSVARPATASQYLRRAVAGNLRQGTGNIADNAEEQR